MRVIQQPVFVDTVLIRSFALATHGPCASVLFVYPYVYPTVPALRTALAKAIAGFKLDIRYVENFPKDQKYISIIKTADEMGADQAS